MGWIPKWSPLVQNVPTVVDDKWGTVAICPTIPGEPADHAWSRACVMSVAPEYHQALADMVTMAKRNIENEELQVEVKKCEALLNRVKELYDTRRSY